MLLKDKVVLITGSNRGIGRGVVEEFAAQGAIVYANARKQGCIDDLALYLKEQYGASVIPVYFDVTDIASAKKAFLRIKKEQGRIDILVNNAGIMQDALIGMIQSEVIHDIFNVNVFAVIELLQMAAKLMMRQRNGSIINISSIVGVNGNKGQLVYSASKGAVISLTKTAAKELAPYNIRVNAIAPGMIDTDMFRSVEEHHRMELINNIGMRRIGTPKDIANVCVFLASDLSGYVTGQILGVDGNAII